MSSRKSRTPFVLLGMLSFESATGYELKAAIEQTVGHFWHESYGQLYPALHELEESGLVTSEELEGGRSKRRFTITDDGRAALSNWLEEPPRSGRPRNELLLKLFFGRFSDAATLHAHLDREELGARSQIGMLEGITEQLRAEEGASPDLAYWLATIDLGRRLAEAKLEWVEATRQALEER